MAHKQKLDPAIAEKSEFARKDITRLFWKYSFFALAGLSFQCIGIVADGFFVGNGVGPIGLATISVILPFNISTFAIYLLFGIGSSTLAAIRLGNGDLEGARNVYGSVMTFALFFSIFLAAIILFNLEPILILFGANQEILPSAMRYAFVFMLAFPLFILGNIAYFFTRLAEKPFAASLSLIAGGILGVIVEYFMIFVWRLGVVGSSCAYIFWVGTTILLVPYLQFSSAPFHIRMSDFRIDFGIILETVKIGFAMFIVQVSTIVSTILINNLILKYGVAELHMAAFGILNAYIAYILTIITTAFVTGIQPIASYNFGAKIYARVAKLVLIGVTQSTIALITVMIVIFALSESIITFFVGPVPSLVEATKEAMRIYLLLYALGNVSQIVSGYYMAVEKNGLAILNGLARVIIFAVPLLLILPPYFSMKGIWMAQPGADLLAFLLALICILGETKRLKKLEAEKH